MSSTIIYGTARCRNIFRIAVLTAGLAVFSLCARAEGDFQPLGGLPGGAPHRGSAARAISADGSVIVGGSESAAGYMEAFRWTRETGMVGLGYLPGGFSSYANAVSADGAVVVGGGNSAKGPKTAFVWTAEKGMQPLADELAAQGVKNVAGWTLEEATGVSADGKTVIGVGRSPAGFSEDFTAVIGLAADTAPDTFAFTDEEGVALSTMITSKPVVITGINTGAPVTIGDGEYSLGCTGKFTTLAGTVRSGEKICVRHMSANENLATINTMLTIGRVADTFTTKTVAGKDGKGSAFDGLSLLTLGLFGLYRVRRRSPGL
jgi:probable HAF family extracellular repeat protein